MRISDWSSDVCSSDLQFLDLGDDLTVLAFRLDRCLGRCMKDRLAGGEMLHDGTENGGLEEVPLLIRDLGHGDEVAAEEHGGAAVALQQALGERRPALGLLRAGKNGGTGPTDGTDGQERP